MILIEFFEVVLVGPIMEMVGFPAFFFEVVLGGLMAGVMYSLVALGFVLIFKASGVFNFAQGVLALFAALTLVGFLDGQLPFAHVINWILGTEWHHWYSPPAGEAGTHVAPIREVAGERRRCSFAIRQS